MATSLFGPTPAELLMARQKEAQEMQMLRNQQIGQQGQQFGVFAPLYQAGLKFGDVGRQAAMQRMFPEQMDPQLQQATAVQSVLSKYVDEDQSDPTVLSKIGRELLSVAPNAGMKALMLAKELQGKQESLVGKINPSDFTPESLQKFVEGGAKDYSILKPTDVAKNKTEVKVDLGGVLSEAFAKKEGAEKAEAWAKAGETYKLSIPLLSELETATKAANNAYFGFGAKGKVGLSKALGAIGIPISERASDSEFLDAISSKLVQRIAKNFPGSQAIKELEQLIKSKPNLEQESTTFLRLLNNVTNEFKAEVIAYEQLSKMPAEKRYAQDFNLVTGQIYRKITRYQELEGRVRDKKASLKEANEALAIKRELGL
jgi:hypothetical protein